MTDSTLLGGRYRLLEPLGRGGMGTVYEAIQEGLGRRVAVKLLDLRLSADYQQLERFRREAETVASLGHPNIVQVTDFQYAEVEGAQPFLVMELLRGESLGQRVAREQVLPGARVAFIAAQMLSALTAAHKAGIVHRDIKPDNVFLLSDAAVPDTVKVLDFGIAKLATADQAKLTGTGAMLGTPAFMAPEQARGAVDVDARADIYAVGATMYQALSGKLPYEAPSIPALLFAIVETTPTLLTELRPDLPSALIEIVERAMAKDRNDRFPDAEAMRRALAPWSGLPASIPPPVSVTAATIASGSIPNQATPIVVHRTPPPKTTSSQTSAPQSKSLALMVMGTIVAVVAIITVGVVVGIQSLKHDAPVTQPKHDDPLAASGIALGQAITQQAVSNVLPNVIESSIPSTSAASALTPPATPRPHRYSNTKGSVSGTDFGDCIDRCDWDTYMPALRAKEAEISSCFAASVLEPPLHESTWYKVTVSDTGELTAFTVEGNDHTVRRIDRCLFGVMKSIPMPMKSARAGAFRLGFRSECPKWHPDPMQWCAD